MTDERDLLGQADALLRRHVPPRSTAGPDVPVLTELISPGGLAAPAQAALSDEDSDDAVTVDESLRRELVAEAVVAVQAKLADELEDRLAQLVAAEVRESVASALADLRRDITGAVASAVDEALARRLQK